MIGSLSGKVKDILGNELILDVGGVGYLVQCTASALLDCRIGEAGEFVIYTDVKEDSIRLFGFASLLEKKVFLMLLGVKGVGAKHALEIVSSFSVRELLRALAHGEAVQLQSVKGIGKKTSERIILELQDKVTQEINQSLAGGSFETQVSKGEPSEGAPPGGAASDAAMALQALGFSSKDAESAVRQTISQSPGITDPGEIVRGALQHL